MTALTRKDAASLHLSIITVLLHSARCNDWNTKLSYKESFHKPNGLQWDGKGFVDVFRSASRLSKKSCSHWRWNAIVYMSPWKLASTDCLVDFVYSKCHIFLYIQDIWSPFLVTFRIISTKEPHIGGRWIPQPKRHLWTRSHGEDNGDYNQWQPFHALWTYMWSQGLFLWCIQYKWDGSKQWFSRRGFSRGKVAPSIMKEIGYHDCDWISHENDWKTWLEFQNWSIPLELHIPCRNPVDHLMSQCNHRHIQFDCNKSGNDMIKQIDGCTLFLEMRYHNRLNDTFPTKCFNAQRITEYQEWIGERLQRKRIEADYVFRRTNKPRQKEEECIWNRTGIQELVKTHLLKKYQYYSFCDQCIGSANDIFAPFP